MALREKTRLRLERIEAAIAAGAAPEDACKEEGITTSWLKQMRTVAGKAPKSKALTVMQLDTPMPVASNQEDTSSISFALNGSPKRVAEFLRMLGGNA